MGRLRDWWNRVTGRNPATTELRHGRAPEAHSQAASEPPGGLSLANGPRQQRNSKTGQSGFDPYSSDAGFAKPHSWERVDHD